MILILYNMMSMKIQIQSRVESLRALLDKPMIFFSNSIPMQKDEIKRKVFERVVLVVVHRDRSAVISAHYRLCRERSHDLNHNDWL